MALYITAHYWVQPEAVDTVKKAIKEFTEYVKANEQGTKLYMAWHDQKDPRHFVHTFIFARFG